MTAAAVSDALQTLSLQRFLPAINGGRLSIYAGVRPAKGAAAVAPLCTFVLANPAGTITGKQLTIPSNQTVAGAVGGVPTWGRFFDSSLNFVDDFDIGTGKEIVFSFGSHGRIDAGSIVRLISLTIGAPFGQIANASFVIVEADMAAAFTATSTVFKFVIPSSLVLSTVTTTNLTQFLQNGVPPYSNFTLNSGGLPPGTTLNSASGVLTSTSPQPQVTATFRAVDSLGHVAISNSVNLSVAAAPFVLNLPSTINLAPSGSLSIASAPTGGTPPYSNFQIIAGAVTGLSLTTAGLFQASSSATGSGLITVQVQDSLGNLATGSTTVSIVAANALVFNLPATMDVAANYGSLQVFPYVSGGTKPYWGTTVSGTLQGVNAPLMYGTLPTNITSNPSLASILTCDGTAVVGSSAPFTFAVQDSGSYVSGGGQNQTVQATTTVRVVYLITLYQGEEFCFLASGGQGPIAPPSGRSFISFQLASNSAALPPGSYFGDGIVHGGQLGMFYANTPNAGPSFQEGLASTGIYPNIYFQGNLDAGGGGGSVVFGPVTIQILPTLPFGWVVNRGGSTVKSVYKPQSVWGQNSSGFVAQDGDVINVQPRTYNSPDGTYTQTITASVTYQSAVGSGFAHGRWTIDCSNTPNGGSPTPIFINTFNFANKTNCNVTIKDADLRGIQNGNDAANSPAGIFSKGMNGGASLLLNISNTVVSGFNSGFAPGGVDQGQTNYATDTSITNYTNCEAFGNGSSAGPAHNAYDGHMAVSNQTGIYSHALRLGPDVHYPTPLPGNQSSQTNGHCWKTKSKSGTTTSSRFSSENGMESIVFDQSIAGRRTHIGSIFIKDPVNYQNNQYLYACGIEWSSWPTSDNREVGLLVYQCHFINQLSNGIPLVFGHVGNPGMTSATGGALGLRPSFARFSYVWVDDNGVTHETLPGGESGSLVTKGQPFNIPAGQLLTVNLPQALGLPGPNVPAGVKRVTGWNIYVGNASGQERLQNTTPIPISTTSWTEPSSTGYTNTGALAKTTGNASDVFPGFIVDIQDSVFAGPNSPAVSANPTDPTVVTYNVGLSGGGAWVCTSVNKTNVVPTTVVANFPQFFIDPTNPTYNFGLKTPVAATGTGYTKATTAYNFPIGTVPRDPVNDWFVGAYRTDASGVPPWAAKTNLPDNCWMYIGTSKISDPSMAVIPGRDSSTLSTIFVGNLTGNWSGGCLNPFYTYSGAYTAVGGGHALALIQDLSNAVPQFNLDLAVWEYGVRQWFDPTKIRASTGSGGSDPNSRGQDATGFSTLGWTGGYYSTYDGGGLPPSPGFNGGGYMSVQSEQKSPPLAVRAEYVKNTPMSVHSAGYASAFGPTQGGDPQGSIFMMTGYAPGNGGGSGPSPAYYYTNPNFAFEARCKDKKWMRMVPTESTDIAYYSGEMVRGGALPYGGACADLRRNKIYRFDAQMANVGFVNTNVQNGIGMFDTVTRVPTLVPLSGSQFGPTGQAGTWFYTMAVYIPSTDPTDVNGLKDIALVGGGAGDLHAIWCNWVATNRASNGADATQGFWSINQSGTKPPDVYAAVVTPGSTPASSMSCQYGGLSYCPDLGPNGSIAMIDLVNMIIYTAAIPADRRNGTWGPWVATPLNQAVNGTNTGVPNPPYTTAKWNGFAGRFNGSLVYAPKVKMFLCLIDTATPMMGFRPPGLL